MYPTDLDEASLAELAASPEEFCRGGSAIVGPLGDYLAGPLYDKEGILSVRIDPTALLEAKFDFDVVGHYARNDVFQLALTNPPATQTAADSSPPREERNGESASRGRAREPDGLPTTAIGSAGRRSPVAAER